MAENTKIQWTDHTFNPWIGCSKVHAGCQHCYAEDMMDRRYGRVVWGPNGTRVVKAEVGWKEPLRWNRQALDLASIAPRPRVFCASLADVFEDWEKPILDHKGFPMFICNRCGSWLSCEAECPCGIDCRISDLTMDGVRCRLFRLIDDTPNLDWLLLTKRPESIRKMWPLATSRQGNPLPHREKRDNVWLGCSVSDQETADEMIPELLKCRDLASKLFVSVEPLLGPIDFTRWFWREDYRGDLSTPGLSLPCVDTTDLISWVIVGGESGPNARPCNVSWIESIVEQCREAGVPCFVKQLGANPVHFDDGGMAGNEMHDCPYQCSDKKGGDPSEWPEALRVRELPS